MMDNEETKEREALSDYSSKIKRIYIELHDYKFFHGPSEVDNLDGRFIGRQKLINRLTSLLTNDETKSGAYLVTGFKGMGKTSLVSKVIANVTASGGGGSVLARYIRIILLLLFLPLVEINSWTIGINIVLIGFLGLYLYRRDLTINNLSDNKFSETIALFWSHFRNILTISKVETSNLKLSTSVHDFLIVLIIRYCSFFVTDPLEKCYKFCFSPSISSEGIFDYTFELHVYLMLIFGLKILNVLFTERPQFVYKAFKSALLSFIEKRSNYSHRIYVKINLGHDNLKEIDILRLIAKNVITQFNEFSSFKLRFPLPDMPSLLFKVIILYTILSIIYLVPPITHINNVIKIKSGLARYFPSQALFMFNDPKVIETTLNNVGNNRNMYLEYMSLFYDNKKYNMDILDNYGLKDNIFHTIKKEQEKSGHIIEIPTKEKGESIKLTIINKAKTDPTIDKSTQDRNEIQKITNAIDMSVNALFYKARDILRIQPLWVIMSKIKELILSNFKPLIFSDFKPLIFSDVLFTRYSFFPRQVDYLFIVYFALLWSLSNLILRYKPLGFRTFESVRRNIADLTDSINATVTRESGVEASVGRYMASMFKLSGKQNKVYPRADAREIEKQLIDVLDEIDKIPKLIKRPQFIFIFDELDKIEPQASAAEKEPGATEATTTDSVQASAGSESLQFSTHEARQRQQTILKILSNFKYFLTTAKAKFIFIAGREIYDASLADVSDRNYFMSSIFHDVIYVSSFLTDSTEQDLYDITKMTELYVCRYLIPSDYIESNSGEYSLKTYRKYLDNLYNKETGKPLVKRLKVEKLIVTISNFITYLTYRSNGSPKKLTRYFEQFVVQPDKNMLTGYRHLCVGKNSNNLYLEFGFFAQYTIGLVSYIATPIIFAIKRTIKDFGDKALVSTAFIVDHIYKYHRHAFTGRSLEVIPEILDINKAPELRELIERIMQFLSRNHIHEILSGPYNFRFIKKTADEISHLSKISERESAAFNFTLDESISLKRHYKAYQKSLEKKYSDSFNIKDTNLIKSISFVHIILGELHFYDEEYHDAIIELQESIQQLSAIDKVQKMDVSTFYIYLRAMMLLGLAYEKGKSFSSAFAMYEKTASVIIEYKKEKNSEHFPESFFENKRHLYQPLLAKLQIIEKRGLNGITYSDIERIEEEHRNLRGGNSLEKFVIESDFFCRLGDILYYKNGLIPGNKSITPYCIEKGFCSKKLPLNTIENAKQIKYPCRACEYYMKSLEILCRDHLGIKITTDKYICISTFMDNKKNNFNMTEILIAMLNTIVDDKPIVDYKPNDKSQRKVTELKVIGNILSNIGDTLLSCIINPEPVKPRGLIKLLESIQDDDIQKNVEKLTAFIEEEKGSLFLVFAFYCTSALFFIAARMHKEYSFQFTKILRLIRECLKVSDKKIITVDKNLIDTIGRTINNRILQGIYKSYENVHRLEIKKFKEIFDDSGNIPNYNNLSISGDIREIIIDYTEIKLKCKPYCTAFYETCCCYTASYGTFGIAPCGILHYDIMTDDIIPNYSFISSYTTVYTMRNRIVELNLKAIINEMLWLYFADKKPEDSKYSNYRLAGRVYDQFEEKAKSKDLIDFFPNSKNKIEKTFGQEITPRLVMEFLITDSIFCLSEIIKISKTYVFSYDMNHSYMAATHLRLAIWCDYYKAYEKYDPEKTPDPKKTSDITDALKNLTGEAETVTIDPNYQYEMARHHCLCAIETHTERKAYKNMIETMYYLNDDFNDSFYHFSAALERFRINTGQIEEILEIAREMTTYEPPKTQSPTPQIEELYNSDKYYQQK
ncbi:conserved hypothetical protein, membrane [Candidatus Magnetobacterium bavaricum]|uniref:Uncharacterized protein n=1 Tax=Candidatus Magnetobacterium bavaricum TaxID=29290 RepID=A0A0F3GT94_9BACT|nr:conserved hypothetical protein, membrane [Candidatus Magnetobacterium bavaricum]